MKVTESSAYHLEATQNVMFMGKEKKTGDVWLLTSKHTDTIIPPIGVVMNRKYMYKYNLIRCLP